jgi:hypothetical protein
MISARSRLPSLAMKVGSGITRSMPGSSGPANATPQSTAIQSFLAGVP